MKLIAFAVLFFALCAGAVSSAAPMTRLDVAQAYYLAKLLYGGHRDAQLPEIKAVDLPTLRKLYGCTYACEIMGAHTHEGVVYVYEGLDFSNPFESTTLFHELVHHLQWLDGGPFKNCAEWMRRERQAFLLEADLLRNFFLDAKSAKLSMDARRDLTCEDPVP